ncbi:MAG: hypothetical protein SGPRY_007937 [Prymnesium sp.]
MANKNAALMSEVSDILKKQGSHLGERQRAKKQARVDKLKEKLVGLALSAYNLEGMDEEEKVERGGAEEVEAEPYKRGGSCATKSMKQNVMESKLKELIGDDGYDSSDPSILTVMPALKMQVQQLKDELANSKKEIGQEKSSVEAVAYHECVDHFSAFESP